MHRRHSHPATHIHFTSGLTGWLRWLGYWMVSRAANGVRALHRLWHTRLQPLLSQHYQELTQRASTALNRTRGDQHPALYRSLAEAVRQRGFLNVRG